MQPSAYYPKFSITLFIILIGALTASHFTSTFINRTEDIEEGKVVVDHFYTDIKNQQTPAINQLMSDTLRKVMGPKGLEKLITPINNKVGSYKNYDIVESNTKRTEGSISQTMYEYKIKVNYEKGTVNEVLGLLKQNNGEPQIVGYHAFSDLLLK